MGATDSFLFDIPAAQAATCRFDMLGSVSTPKKDQYAFYRL
jgi:hypothetical protein